LNKQGNNIECKRSFVVLHPYNGGNFDRKTTKVFEELNGFSSELLNA
jgi:hypothetical protein